ncbi:hypothetical protein POX_f08104 [Penicillium oxalicum]|uniref:hypothetical protein n=1 Tax=Penicillium oxalicum TaxID=69781 RepID=UPI0020B762FB|nr:hypothetical protein POX_f08104 [Penicillium oxalicum]KAI2787729.1 hypothetical protein POX_f08104 [Penicillium oxalicum]
MWFFNQFNLSAESNTTVLKPTYKDVRYKKSDDFVIKGSSTTTIPGTNDRKKEQYISLQDLGRLNWHEFRNHLTGESIDNTFVYGCKLQVVSAQNVETEELSGTYLKRGWGRFRKRNRSRLFQYHQASLDIPIPLMGVPARS